MVMLGRKERVRVRARVGMDVGGYYCHVALEVKFEFFLLRRHGRDRECIYQRLMWLLT